MTNQTKRLSDCKKACVVKVIKLHADAELKRRLISFSIMKGAVVEVLEYAPAKSTIEIKVGKMRIALRAKEAEQIEVEKI
ncbi:FeoA family protein [Sulfurimonas sp.]|jgi:ferrous iron transport protein A|uniref:FeoA family protein n=1 Tax=Sulfurimonas sp. TaxID=2022749 RepID=UPI0025F8F9A4|nr:FeoA family protein [Sulfurimonas sp.]MCK9473440.1 ferrous iron transport protein A [Sulfurimonas sp.]